MSDKRPGGILRDLSLPALFFATAGLWIVFQLVFRIGSLTLITVITTVIGGLFFGAVMTVLVAVNRRRLGGRQQLTDFPAALRTGTPHRTPTRDCGARSSTASTAPKSVPS